MKYQFICSGATKISQKVQEKIINEFSKVEKLLYKSENFDCRIVVKFRNNRSKIKASSERK